MKKIETEPTQLMGINILIANLLHSCKKKGIINDKEFKHYSKEIMGYVVDLELLEKGEITEKESVNLMESKFQDFLEFVTNRQKDIEKDLKKKAREERRKKNVSIASKKIKKDIEIKESSKYIPFPINWDLIKIFMGKSKPVKIKNTNSYKFNEKTNKQEETITHEIEPIEKINATIQYTPDGILPFNEETFTGYFNMMLVQSHVGLKYLLGLLEYIEETGREDKITIKVPQFRSLVYQNKPNNEIDKQIEFFIEFMVNFSIHIKEDNFDERVIKLFNYWEVKKPAPEIKPDGKPKKSKSKEYNIAINPDWYTCKGENAHYTKVLRALIYESGQDNYLLPLGVYYALTLRAQTPTDKVRISTILDHLNIDENDRIKNKGRHIKGIDKSLSRLRELGMLASYSIVDDMVTVTASKQYMTDIKKGRLDEGKGRLDEGNQKSKKSK